MDTLNEVFGSQDQSVSLSDLVPQNDTQLRIPQATIRNEAAKTALLSGEDSPTDTYQTLVAEAEAGDDTTSVSLNAKIAQDIEKENQQGMMSILADPKVSTEQKIEALKNIRKSQFLSEPSVKLMTDGLSKPVKDESVDSEKARLTISDLIREIDDSVAVKQGLVNAHGANLDSLNAGTAVDATANLFLSFLNNISIGKINRDLNEKQGTGSLWKTIKGFVLPGTVTKDIREELARIPVDQRQKFTSDLIDSVVNNSSTVPGNKGQFMQMVQIQKILGDSDYSATDEWMDNIFPLFDIFGLKALAKGLRKTPEVAQEATKIEQVAQGTKTEIKQPVGTVTPTSSVKPEIATVSPPPDKIISDYRDEIAKLQEQKANILGDANELDRGQVRSIQEELKSLDKRKGNFSSDFIASETKRIQREDKVSFKDAKKKASANANEAKTEYESIKSRLEGELGRNASGNKISQEIAQLENQIETLSKSPGKVVEVKLSPIADAIRRIDLNAALRKEVPASPASIVSQVNPDQARAFHAAVFTAKDDVAAEALYGVPRMDAIASDVLPQISTQSGRVTSKVQDIEKYLSNEIDTLTDIMNSSGALQFTKAEKLRAETHVLNDFSSADGLTLNNAMSSFKNDGGRIKVAAVYGNAEGAFSDAKQAFEQAKNALKYHGIMEEDITILRKEGLDHAPVDIKSVEGVPGNYLVKVESNYDITSDMLGKMDEFSLMKNWLDAIPQLVWDRKGSATRWLFDPASILDKSITGSAIEATDKSAVFERTMLELASNYTDKYNALSKAEKGMVSSYIKEANTEGIALDTVDLLSRGFSNNQIQAVTDWRKFWDAHYYLENLDIIRTLDMQGYNLLQNDKGLSLFTKRMEKDKGIARLYDPQSDSIVSPSKEDMDRLYEMGGSYGKLKRPVEMDGVLVEHVIIPNDSTNYLRKLRSDDTALNYRDGYYQIHYNAPKFVDEIVKEGDRIISRKAVAVAGDSNEASSFASRMQSNNPDKEYKVRGDDRAMKRGNDDWWDVNAASGRIAQRHRGKLLEDSSGLNHLGDGSYMLDPVSSAVKAAKSISMRTMMRPVIETQKQRFMSKYADLLPSNGRGGVGFPGSFADIGAKGETVSSKIKDARTEYEYIRFIENGYINSVDEAFKATMFRLAEITKANSKAEKTFLSLTDVRPTNVVKSSVFNAYLVGHPLRQTIIQSHQAVRSMAYNLPGWLDGGVIKHVLNYTADLAGAGSTKSSRDFVDFINTSGIMEAVDKHNLVRGTLLDAVGDARILAKSAKVADKVLSIPRKYGFGLGEQGSMLIHAAAVYDKFARDGKNLLDKTVRAEAHSELRAITGDMNFAGDMPQNSTSLAAIFQFMQVPQKMLLQVTNRRLDVPTRLKLFAGDVLMWGSPTVLLASHLTNGDILPEDQKLREILLLGAESMLFNNLLREITNDPTTNVDFSSLSPSDTTSIRKMITTMLADGPLAAIAASPFGGLVGDQGRVQNALRSIARLVKGSSEYDKDPVTFLQTIHEVGKIFSGVNDATNAWLALETKRSFDKIGRKLDGDVHTVEAALMAFGFKDASQRDMFVVLEQAKKDQKSYKDTVLRDYKLAMQYIVTKAGEDNTSPEVIANVTGFILNKYKNDPVAQEIISKQMVLDSQSAEDKTGEALLKLSGIKSPSEMKDLVRVAPIPDSQKQQWFELIKNLDTLRNRQEK
jgi:hypothetical protein